MLFLYISLIHGKTRFRIILTPRAGPVHATGFPEEPDKIGTDARHFNIFLQTAPSVEISLEIKSH